MRERNRKKDMHMKEIILCWISKGIFQYTTFRENEEETCVFLALTLSRFSIKNYTWARDYQTFIAEISYTQYYLRRGFHEEIGLPVEGVTARGFIDPAILCLGTRLSAMFSIEECAV